MTVRVRVIPCLDVANGRVVKGVNFVDLRDAGDPVEQARAYDAAGADELCFLDITASHEARGTILDVVRRTAEVCFMPLTVGGGVRSVEDARALLLAGADKVAVNSAAVARPELVARDGRPLRQPVRRRLGRRAARRRRLGSLHPWRPARRPGSTRSRTRCGLPSSARASCSSPRWTATARATGYDLALTRTIADQVERAGGRLGRRRRARRSRRRHPRRPCQRGARRVDLPFRRGEHRRRARRTGRGGDSGAARRSR